MCLQYKKWERSCRKKYACRGRKVQLSLTLTPVFALAKTANNMTGHLSSFPVANILGVTSLVFTPIPPCPILVGPLAKVRKSFPSSSHCKMTQHLCLAVAFIGPLFENVLPVLLAFLLYISRPLSRNETPLLQKILSNNKQLLDRISCC